jgi:exopolysaccharide biosynthesis polyprenyl glycosylphosphotransferase
MAIDTGCLLVGASIVGIMSDALRQIDGLWTPVLLVMPLLWVTVLRSFGLYRPWSLSGWDQFRRLVCGTGLGIIVVLLASPVWSVVSDRSLLLGTWLLVLSLEMLGRGLFDWAVGRLVRDGRLAIRTAILGTGEESRRVADALSSVRAGYITVGYVAIGDGSAGNGLPVLGSFGEIESIIDREAIECVFLPPAVLETGEVLRVSRACRRTNVEMRAWADVPGVLAGRMSFQPVGDAAVLTLPSAGPLGARSATKRCFDLIVSLATLVLTLPLFVVVAAAIRATSRGPVLFRQDRVTKDGRVFPMYKFRTMVVDPSRALEGKTLDLTTPFFKLRDDPRLTGVGRVIRNWSLDELPQLLNVLRGEMSMVGPRPLPVDQVAANLDILAPRHEVRCGITGWWQVSGRSAIDSKEAVRLDQFYIENWSIGLDVYILLRTVGAVIARKGAW